VPGPRVSQSGSARAARQSGREPGAAFDRRRFIQYAGLTVGSLAFAGVAGCGKSAGGSVSKGTYTGQQAVTHLDEIVAAAPWKIADAEGYFKQASLNVKSVSFAGGGDVVRAVQTKMDFGTAATLATLIAYQKALKSLRIVAGAFNAPEVVYLVGPKSKIASARDLGGKKIGVSDPGSNSTYFANLMAERSGFKPGKDVKIIAVGGPADAFTALQHGVVDVAWSAPPFSTKQVKGNQAKLLVDTRDLAPQWVDTAMITKQPFIDSDPDVLKHWIGAIGKAIALIKSDPEKAGSIWAKTIGLDAAVTTQALHDYRDAFDLSINRAGVEANVRAGQALKQLKGSPPLDEIIEPKLLPSGASG
jgi:NitT/TauT family transport system substrate-binding protein